MLVSCVTFHSQSGPCGPVEQSPNGDSLMHESTSALRSSLFCGRPNPIPANAVGRCWRHAGKLMEGTHIKGKVEARDITQIVEVTQVSNISGFAR